MENSFFIIKYYCFQVKKIKLNKINIFLHYTDVNFFFIDLSLAYGNIDIYMNIKFSSDVC